MTRTVKIIFGVFLLFAQTSFGQIINPSFNSREVSYCDITKVERTSYNTTVYFKYTAPSTYTNGGWVCAGGGFFIRDAYSRTKYKLIKANNIPICPSKHDFQYQGQTLEFNIVFEAIPTSTSKIDIIEDEIKGGFNFFGVVLITSNNTTNETKILKSEAKMRELDSPISNTLYTLPAGTQVKILGLTGGYYKVEYNGKIGYINELFFQNSGINNYTSTPSNSSSYSTPKKWDEYNLKEHWKTNGMDKIEGIYESTGSSTDIEVPCTNGYGQTICYMTWRNYDPKYKVALIKTDGDYKLIYLSGTPKGSEKVGGCNCDGNSYIAPESNKWSTGEVKARLYKTATHDFYKCDWYMGNKSLNSDGYISFDNYAYFKLILSGNESMYLKLYPTSDDNIGQNTNKTEKSSGTGYAISSNGYIVTNHHVTNGATSIKIRGVNGDFSKTYTAKVVIEDKNNDLSIIKIDDPSFTSLGTIPYIIANRASDVGSSVFVLGYPLRATMGDEVKLTNGIISSKSGFQGDVTSYQITAPVQPGNSGGPLFDDKGNIIGIINAKHVGAENASYAIKASYLMNLIDLMPTPPKLQAISTVAGKPLTEQVKILKKFTYIIEINQ